MSSLLEVPHLCLNALVQMSGVFIMSEAGLDWALQLLCLSLQCLLVTMCVPILICQDIGLHLDLSQHVSAS